MSNDQGNFFTGTTTAPEQALPFDQGGFFPGERDLTILTKLLVYSSTRNYEVDDFVIDQDSAEGDLFRSRTNNNLGNALTDTDNWEAVSQVTDAEIDAALIRYLMNNPLSDSRLFVQSATPTTGLVNGAIWINTSGVTNTLNIYNSTQGQFNLVESVTNLAANRDATSVTITSSSGTDATIPSANTASAGVMSRDDKVKLDGIEAGADIDRGGRTWSTTATYNFGDIVTRLGRQYQAIVGTPTVGADPEVTTTEWKRLINNTIPTADPVDAAEEFIRQTTAPSIESVRTIRDTVDTLLSWSNIPRLTANLVADQEYTVWVNNRSTSNTNSITRTAIDIQGQDATTLVNPGVATSGRVTAFYVTFNGTTVGDIQNNATNTEPTITFTSPNEVVRIATGEGNPGSTLTGTEIINLVNEAETTGRINADHVTQPTLDPSAPSGVARITLDNMDDVIPNSVVNLIGRGGITVGYDSANARDITFSGTAAPHAQLRTGLTISPNTFDRSDGAAGSSTITGTPTASISDAATGDVVNSITINSAHASYLDNNLNIRTTGTPRFTYSILTTAPAQTIVFTCVFTVNYTVDGVTMDHQVTHTGNLLVRQAPITFRYGTFTQDQFTMRDSLSAAQIATALSDTADGITYPYSQDYTGTAIPTNTYAAIFVPDEDGVITSVRSEGFVLNFERRRGVDVGGVIFSLYTVTAPLSEGTHTIEWRT